MPWVESARIRQVQAPMIPVVGEWIAQHPGTISLGQGVVHYRAPEVVGTRVIAAVERDPQVDRYGLVLGTEGLLQAIGQKLNVENQTMLADRSVVVTTGSNMGFLNAVLAIADWGDEIILVSPYYFNHEMAIEIAGCRVVVVATDTEYQLDLERLASAVTSRTKAIVTVSPNNPTGAVYPADRLTEVNALCRERGIYHISDEAYEYFNYSSEPHFSPASLPDSAAHTISLYTLSKAYGMAGWRVGYMVVPDHLVVAVKKIQDTNLVCPPMVNQLAAEAALTAAGPSWCAERIVDFPAVRDLVLEALAELGPRCYVPRPEGAFYALLQLQTQQQDLELVEALIRQYGVAVMPGSTFGVSAGCTLRVAFGALDRETVAEGMGRLVHGLNALLVS